MNKNRVLYGSVALALVIMSLLTARLAVANNAVTAGAKDTADYYLRHPSTTVDRYFPGKEQDDSIVVTSNGGASDWFQRHPESLQPANAPDTSDYYLRHPNSTGALDAGASDWFQRHPEAMHRENATDFTDRYSRLPNGAQQ